MKKVFILCASVVLLHTHCLGMIAKKIPVPQDPLKSILSKAFEAFGMSAEHYSIHVHSPLETPDTDTDRWTVLAKELEFLNDITAPPARFEFAAYWCAAYIKNNAHKKTELCYWGSLASIIFGSTAASLALMSQNSPNSCIAASGSLCAALLATVGCDMPKRLQTRLEDFYVARALDQACAKLIAQKNLKPIAEYYAFCQSRKRGVRDWQNHTAIITQKLADAKYQLVSVERANSREVRIINPNISQNNEVANAFCSLAWAS